MAEETAGHNTGDSLVAPLTPPACDLTGLEFMPLKLQSLFDSDFYALSSGDEFKVGLKLWGKSWHEKPAASLPSDETLLAKKAGVSLETWRQLAPMALHKWIKCSDGRLYHPTVAREALRAWIDRIGYRKRGSAGAAGKAKSAFNPATFDDLKEQAEHFLAALENGAASTPSCLKQAGELPEAPNPPAKRDLQDGDKSAKGSGVEGSEGKGSEVKKTPSGSKNNILLSIDDGWALDEAAIEDGIVQGFTRPELEAAATQHRSWWNTNQPNAKKTCDGWVQQWRKRLDDLADDPEARSKLMRAGGAKVRRPEFSPAPAKGPQWWRDAGAKLHATNPAAWTSSFAGAIPHTERGIVTAATEAAAQRINDSATGLDVTALIGFPIRAVDPEEARIQELERTDPARAQLARSARQRAEARP